MKPPPFAPAAASPAALPPLARRALWCALLGLGLLVAWLGAVVWLDGQAQRHWPATEGVVLQSELRAVLHQKTRQERATRRWQWVLVYRYQVQGRRYEGTRYASAQPGADADEGRPPPPELNALLESHPVGAPVTVYHDPADPGQAVLQRSSGGHWAGLAAGLALLAGAAALGPWAWRRKRPPA